MTFTNPPSVGYEAPDPRNYASSADIAARARETVRSAVAAARDARGTLPETWQRNFDAYFGIRHRKNFRGRANVVDPEPFRVIETIVAREDKALFGSKPWLRGFPGPGMPHRDLVQAQINESLLQQQLETGSRGARLFPDALKACAIFGTHVFKVQWDDEYRRRKVRDPRTGKLLGPRDVGVWRGPRWRSCELEDFFVADPSFGTSVEDQDYVVERKLVRIQDLQILERSGVLVNTGKISSKAIQSRFLEEEAAKSQRASLIGAMYDKIDPSQSPVGKCELEMFEGPFDLYNKGDEIECWIWVANGDTVVRVTENQNWHGRRSYVNAKCISLPGYFYGMSPLQHILDLWCELNDMHNMGLDSATLTLNPGIKVGAAAGIDYKNWVLAPGAFLPCNDISQVEPFVIPPLTQVALQAMGPIRQMMRETTSATDLLQAQSTGGIDKATIYQGALIEANVRIAQMAKNFGEAMQDGANIHWALNQQYLDQDTLVRIMGKDGFEWVPVRPEDLKYPMDWHAVGVQNVGAELTRNFGLERFLSVATPLALQGAVPLDFVEIFKTYWTSLGMADADKIIASRGPKPMNPAHENLLLAQRQPVDVHPQENLQEHYRAHLLFADEIEGAPNQDPVVLRMLQEHIQATEEMFRQVEAAKQQMAAYQAQMAMNQLEGPQRRAGGNGSATPASANQQNLGPQMGAAKDIGELIGGRRG